MATGEPAFGAMLGHLRLQQPQADRPGLPTLALGAAGGRGQGLSRGLGRAGADQRATGAPAGFPRRTAGAGVALGSSSGGRLGKAGVSGPGAQPINLQSPRETLRGFAFCLANYSASTLFLSWGAQALCRSLIKKKPLSQLPQGWGNQ